MDFGTGAVEIARGFEVAQAKHAVFYRSDAVDAPLIVGDRLGELALDRWLRVEAGYDFFGKGLVGVHVFGGKHDDARSEAVAQRVHAGAGFASGSAVGGGRRWSLPGRFVIYRFEPVGCIQLVMA